MNREIRKAKTNGLEKPNESAVVPKRLQEESHDEYVPKVERPETLPRLLGYRRTISSPKNRRKASKVIPTYSRRPVQNLDSPDELLMRFVLENTRGLRASEMRKFINTFTLDVSGFIAEPAHLAASLRHAFGQIAGETVFRLFMSIRPKSVQSINPWTGAFAPAAPSYFGGYGFNDPTQAIMSDPDYLQMLVHEKIMEEREERREEQRMNRIYRRMSTQTVQSLRYSQALMNRMRMGGMPWPAR